LEEEKKEGREIIKHFTDSKAMIQKLCCISTAKRSSEKRKRGCLLLEIALVLLSEAITAFLPFAKEIKNASFFFFFPFRNEHQKLVYILWTVCLSSVCVALSMPAVKLDY